MTKPILLLQFRTDESLEHERQCILKVLGLSQEDLVSVNVADANSLIPARKDLKKYRALILGGSAQFYITTWDENLKTNITRIEPLIKEAVKLDFPTFGICFGHQLFAYFLGGKVERDESQIEGGVVKVKIDKDSPIFSNTPHEFEVATGHKDSVTKLAKGSVALASTDKCKFAAVRIKKNIFTVQFHPELSLDDLVWKLSKYPDYAKGRSAEELKRDFSKMPYATKPLTNFYHQIGRKDNRKNGK